MAASSSPTAHRVQLADFLACPAARRRLRAWRGPPIATTGFSTIPTRLRAALPSRWAFATSSTPVDTNGHRLRLDMTAAHRGPRQLCPGQRLPTKWVPVIGHPRPASMTGFDRQEQHAPRVGFAWRPFGAKTSWSAPATDVLRYHSPQATRSAFRSSSTSRPTNPADINDRDFRQWPLAFPRLTAPQRSAFRDLGKRLPHATPRTELHPGEGGGRTRLRGARRNVWAARFYGSTQPAGPRPRLC
jgi:hypothetical protein